MNSCFHFTALAKQAIKSSDQIIKSRPHRPPEHACMQTKSPTYRLKECAVHRKCQPSPRYPSLLSPGRARPPRPAAVPPFVSTATRPLACDNSAWERCSRGSIRRFVSCKPVRIGPFSSYFKVGATEAWVWWLPGGITI